MRGDRILGMSDTNDNIFKGSNMIRHRDTLDVDLAILHVQYDTESYVKLKILYYNRNYDRLIDLRPQIVKIKTSDKHKWSLVKKHAY